MEATKYKDSGIPWIGMIPDDWEVIKLKQIVQCLDSRRVPIDAGDRIKGSYPYWGAGSIVDYVDNYIFDEELILLGEDGAPFFDKTRPVAFLVKERIWVNNHIHVLKTIRDCASYITYCLNTVDYTHYINGSILNKLTQSNMNKIAIILPPLPTQQRIADFLDRKCAEIDELAALQETMIAELKRYKQSVITEAVTKGLDPDVAMKDSGVEWIGEIPKGWKVKRLKYISYISRGLFNHRPRNDERFYGGKYPFIQTGDVARAKKYIESYTQTLSDLGIAVSKLFPKGTLTMTIAANVGDVSILGFDAYFPDSVLGIVPNSNIDNMYLFYALKSMKTELVNAAIVSTQLNLNIERVYNMEITVPPMSEQQQIADYLDRKCAEIAELIAIKQQKIDALKEYKKSVIFEYVTGKKEVLSFRF